MTDLSNRIALVTGASRGIGRATALRLSEQGARVIVHYGASREAADALVADIRGRGGQADAVPADLAAADGPHQLIEAVRALGIDRLDVIVANAGISVPAALEAETLDSFDRHYAINVRAPYFLVQQALPLLGEGSSVVLLSSVVARVGFPGTSVYTATKGAIDSLTRVLARELGPRGIRVNAIAPGAIDTDMARAFFDSEESWQQITAQQALDRIGKPEDVADAILFLASDQSRWVDGRALEVSGGAML